MHDPAEHGVTSGNMSPEVAQSGEGVAKDLELVMCAQESLGTPTPSEVTLGTHSPQPTAQPWLGATADLPPWPGLLSSKPLFPRNLCSDRGPLIQSLSLSFSSTKVCLEARKQ